MFNERANAKLHDRLGILMLHVQANATATTCAEHRLANVTAVTRRRAPSAAFPIVRKTSIETKLMLV